MHRHGCIALRPHQAIGPSRCASTAVKLKTRESDTPGSASTSQYSGSTSSAPANAAALRATALRKNFAKWNNARPGTDQRLPSRNQPANSFSRNESSNELRRSGLNPGLSFRSNENGMATPSSLGLNSNTQPQYNSPGFGTEPQNTPARVASALGSETSRQAGPVYDTTSTRSFAPPSQEPASRTDMTETARHHLKSRPARARQDEKFKSRGSLLERAKTGSSFQPFKKNEHSQHLHKPKITKTARKNPIKRENPQVFIPSTVSVSNLARILSVKPAYLKRKVEQVGITDQATYDYVLTADYAALLAEEFGRTPIVDDEAAFDLYPPKPHHDSASLPLRPPIVTIMGHVDHGKTTLLDTLRSTAVAKGEAGGITQHIGAFSVPVQSQSTDGVKSITFLDTPGHAAFSAMRARGAGVTDIIVLVVAADDGLMPQTKEVIELYKKSQDTVGLVLAINKVDKPAIDIEAVEKALMAEEIQLESYGGDTPAVYVSGLTGKGLPDLVETLSAMAEMQDLRAEQDGFAYGEILESKVQQGLGMVGTVLVTRGCLKVGSHILSGQSYAKVRRMTDSNGKTVQVAKPGMAITVSGWKTLPQAGDNIIEASESDVKKALNNRIREAEIESSLANVDAINESRRNDREQRLAEEATPPSRTQYYEEINTDSGMKELRLVIKADVSGSAEAVEGALQGIGNNIAVSRIISTGVGDVSESDIMLAKAANATVVAFSVGVPRSVQSIANQNGVPICTSNIIYKLMDDVREQVRALLPVIVETRVTGEANVIQLFEISLKGKAIKKVAGCRVTNGLVEKSKFARVVRNGQVLHEGSLDTLKHLKKDVAEVRKGTECGLSFDDFADVREGDVIQMFERIEKLAVL